MPFSGGGPKLVVAEGFGGMDQKDIRDAADPGVENVDRMLLL
jgi:hypothetical protein